MISFIRCDFFWFQHGLGHLQFLTSLLCPAALLRTLCSSVFISTRCSQSSSGTEEGKLVARKTICQMSHVRETTWRHLIWARPNILIAAVTSCDVTPRSWCLHFSKMTGRYNNIRAVKVSALIDAINVAAINALKYFNGASSLICNFIKVNTNMSHFLFLTLTLQQAPRLLHSPSSFTTDAPTNQPMRACYPTQPHPIGLELSHVPPRPVHWRSGHLSTYLITL